VPLNQIREQTEQLQPASERSWRLVANAGPTSHRMPVLDPDRDHHGQRIRSGNRKDIYQLVDVPAPSVTLTGDG
jgi:hypothetical protein